MGGRSRALRRTRSGPHLDPVLLRHGSGRKQIGALMVWLETA